MTIRIGVERIARHGYGFAEIANRLNDFETIDKSNRDWNATMVKTMLMSETYAGDILTNKTVVIHDSEGTRQVPNNGISEQYLIENHHQPLVGRKLSELF